MRRKRPIWLELETAAVYLFLYAPIAVLVLFSFNRGRSMASWEGFTLAWYRELLRNATIQETLLNSLIVAFSATAISAVIGTMAALAMDRFNFPGKRAFDALVHLPIVIPEIVMAVSLVLFFGSIGLRLGLATVIIAHVAFCVPYMILVVRARLAGFDRSLEEAAQDLGADEATTFFKVTLPNIMPGIVSGSLLVFTISFDDFVITSFVSGVGSTTLPVQVYSMVKQGVTPEINAISTLTLLVTVALVYISQRFGRRQ